MVAEVSVGATGLWVKISDVNSEDYFFLTIKDAYFLIENLPKGLAKLTQDHKHKEAA